MLTKARVVGLSSLAVAAIGGLFLSRVLNQPGGEILREMSVCGAGQHVTANTAFGIKNGYDDVAAGSFSAESPGCIATRTVQDFITARDTSRFFYDAGIGGCSGEDSDPTNGIDTATVFFFVGTGDPTGWPAGLPEPGASTACMCIGNQAVSLPNRVLPQGTLRYYWQASCQVFAHGPLRLKPGGRFMDFLAPGDFSGGDEADVFSRWGPAIGSGLRMACGASSRVTAGIGDVQAVWANKKAFFDVSDSFLVGMHSQATYIPVCLARGGGRMVSAQSVPAPESSTLYDKVFISTANPNGTGDYFYLEYVKEFEDNPPPVHAPLQGPALGYSMAEVESRNGLGIFERGRNFLGLRTGSEKRTSDDIEVFHDEGVQALPLVGGCPGNPKCLSDVELVERGRQFIARNGWMESDLANAPTGLRLEIVSQSVRGAKPCPLGDRSAFQVTSSDGQKFEKGAALVFRRVRGKNKIPEAGLDGVIVINIAPSGDVVSAWKKWRHISGSLGQFDLDEAALVAAESSARSLLKDEAPQYDLGRPAIVLKEVDSRLVPTFVFTIQPKNDDALREFPPRILEISAEKR